MVLLAVAAGLSGAMALVLHELPLAPSTVDRLAVLDGDACWLWTDRGWRYYYL